MREEVEAFLASARAAAVAPTVVALRSKAAEVVEAELNRLSGRLPEIDERARKEVEQTVRRVVDKLLHAPTVRMKELAAAPGGDSYADALRELFDLDPKAPEAVARADMREDEPAGAPVLEGPGARGRRGVRRSRLPERRAAGRSGGGGRQRAGGQRARAAGRARGDGERAGRERPGGQRRGRRGGARRRRNVIAGGGDACRREPSGASH